MKKTKLLFLILNALTFHALAQFPHYAYCNIFKGEPIRNISAIEVDNNGNTYVAGDFSSTIDLDPSAAIEEYTPEEGKSMFVQKTNAAGELIFNRVFHSTKFVKASDLAVDEDGNIYIVGVSDGTVDFDPDAATSYEISTTDRNHYVLKLDPTGAFLWMKNYNNISAVNEVTIHQLAISPNNDLYFTGTFLGVVDLDPSYTGVSYHTSFDVRDAYTLKMTSDGDFVWASVIQKEGEIIPESITIDSQNNPIMACRKSGLVYLEDSNGNLNEEIQISHSVYKYDSAQGVKLFEYNAVIAILDSNTTQTHKLVKVASDAYDNIYVNGHFAGEMDFNNGNVDDIIDTGERTEIYLYKLNSDGEFIWGNTYGQQEIQQTKVTGMDVSDGGDIYIVGLEQDTNTQSILLKLDAEANVIWTEAWTENENLYTDELCVTSANRIYMTGKFYGIVDMAPGTPVTSMQASGSSPFVLKLSPFGLGLSETTIKTKILSHADTSRFTIVLDENQQNISVAIYNSLGQYVAHNTYKNTNQCDVYLPEQNGLYIAVLTREDGESIRVKLMKN